MTALIDLCLASVFGTWYWTRNKANVSFFGIIITCMRTIYYHSGTAAYGALPFIYRFVIGTFTNGKSHSLCTRVSFFFIDKSKPSNRNAYILCAIRGTAFSASAFDAIQLVTKHVRRTIAVDTLNVVFLIVICEAVGTVVSVSFVWISLKYLYNDIPVLAFSLAVAGVYIIVSVFGSACCVAVHTLLLCIRKYSIEAVLRDYFNISPFR